MPLPSTFLDNAATLAQSTTVGFKISKPGYNAGTTGGQNMVFDSSWPSLSIGFDTTIPNPVTSFSAPLTTIPHGLGFAPFCMGWYYGPDVSGLANTSSRFLVLADTKNIYLNANYTGCPPFTATTLKLRAFQLDLNKDINYSLAPGDTSKSAYDNSFGVKITKSTNQNISSTDMRDYSLHSRCQSPLILAVKTQATANPGNANVVQYTNHLSYPVWFYGFLKMGSSTAANIGVPANTFLPAPYYNQAYPRTFTDGFTGYLQWTNTGGSADNGATMVVLRDPMFAATQKTVQF